MNSPIRPRILTHRGVVSATALCLDPSFISEIEARRRVLDLWESGAQLSQIGELWLLRFASPRPFLASQAPGTPLVEREGWLLSAPLSPSEWKAFRAQNSLSGRENVVLVRDGALQIAVPSVEIDPSLWLDVSDWQSPPLEPLGEIAAPILAAPPLEFEARRALDVPASAELDAFLARMRGETTSQNARGWRFDWFKRFGRGGESDGGVGVAGTGAGAAALGFSLSRLFQFRFGAGGNSPQLSAGERFSGEFGIVARPTFLLVLLALLVSLLVWPRDGFSGALTLFLALLLLLIPVALMAWGLMVVARFFRVPSALSAKIAATPPRNAALLPFDLIALLATCGLFFVFLGQRDWFWASFMLTVAAYRAALAHWRRRRTDSRGYSAQNAASNGDAARPRKPPKAPNGAWQRFLWRTELGQLLGNYQARYILKMMAMFERGDLDGALRHAVPFSVFGDPATHPSLSLLKARGNLDFLGARAGSGGGGVALPPQIKEQLTKLYRGAFESLEAQNRVDEAAFVLAELLDSPSEAVQFLEKHGKWPVAAQLSEVRELDAGLTVRLWWLAENRSRAVVAARRGNAWADAISRLERGGEKAKEGARQLRLLWAQSLAVSGDFAGAVEAAWPLVSTLPELRGVVGAWIERGLEGQGASAARMLARQAHLLPDLSAETLSIWRERTQNLLDDSDESSVGLRLQFAELLSGAPTHPLSRAAARRAVRSLCRDAARFPTHRAELSARIKDLLAFAGDAALRADTAALPNFAAPPSLSNREEPLKLRFEAPNCGSREVFDGALLPDGRVLLALGEAGAQLHNRGGAVGARFNWPCHRLVVSPLGERVLGVAMRGADFRARFAQGEARAQMIAELGIEEYGRRAGQVSLCRFDLTRREVSAWGEMNLGQWAPTFDGFQWIVSIADTICSLDATSEAPLVLWRTPNAGHARALASDAQSLAMLSDFYERGKLVRSEVWRFDLPALILRQRSLLPVEPSYLRHFIAPDGFVLAVQAAEAAELNVNYGWQEEIALIQCPPRETVCQVEARGDWIVVMSALSGDDTYQNSMRLHVFSRHDRRILLRCQIELEGTSRAHFRLSETSLCVGDSSGRFLALDLQSGTLLKNLRVR